MKQVVIAKQTSKFLKTSISLPKDVHRAAFKKASAENRSWSNYIVTLLQRDLGMAK